MSPEEVAALTPVGEFGSREWCLACADAGVALLKEGDIPADLNWAFTEEYLQPPARLITDGRELAGYYLMVRDGVITGGDGVPAECLTLPGFHVQLPWAAICNQSRTKYGSAGQRQRSAEEKVMYQEIADYLGGDNPLGILPIKDPFWPAPVVAAVSKGKDDGAGLHNIAAALQAPSPEFEHLPVTALGVPMFGQMTEGQKASFLDLFKPG